jgi:hypothetical protein
LETGVLAYNAGCGEGMAVIGDKVEGYGFDEEVAVSLGFVIIKNIEFESSGLRGDIWLVGRS